jgi:hypothetical protein
VKRIDGKEVEVARELTDEDFFYLHDDYTVTDGVFLDENLIYDTVSPEWISFCKEVLAFEIPNDAPTKIETGNQGSTNGQPLIDSTPDHHFNIIEANGDLVGSA